MLLIEKETYDYDSDCGMNLADLDYGYGHDQASDFDLGGGYDSG